MDFLIKRRKRIILFTVITILMIIMATILVQFDWIAVIIKLPKVIERFFELYFPMDFEDLSKMLEALLFTIMLAIASSFTGIFIGFPFALMISKKTNNNKIVSEIARFIATIFRVIPPGIWALIFIFVFWFGYFLAYLVLTLYSFGFLARTFAEVFDETNPNCIEALKTTGASYSQIIFHGVIPEVMPSVVSWSLYDIENNIRNSTIIGLLTGAGLGYLISIYRHFREFESLIVAVLLVVITIILIDNLAMQIRKRILS